MNETSQALSLLTKAFNILDISYRIVGSVASSVQGMVRATLDIDIVANVQKHHISALENHLRDTYYIDTEMIKEAIQNHSSFNLIHLETMIKVDVFILGQRPYDHISFERKKVEILDDLSLSFKTPEDVLLGKLEWFEKTEHSSSRQWTDIIGILKVQNELDYLYLRQWANEIGILDQLEKAIQESQL